ncbi:hypothetical protein Q361_1041, partial [Flavobacterium croceum DSM 17960]
MRNNYFLRWTQRMMFLFTLLCGLSMVAQSSFSISFPSFSSAPTSNPRSLEVCNSSSKLQVQLDVTTASTTGASVTIQLGAGVEYVPGSVAVVSTNAGLTIVDDGGTPNAPKFKVGPNALALANRLVFTIDRKATCATRTAALAGTAFKDTVTGSITGATATTEVSSTYSVTYPAFTFTQPVSQNNALMNTNYTRTFTISNGGSGSVSQVYFSIDYPSSGIQNVSVTLTGGSGSTGTPLVLTPTSTSGTTSYYTIPSSNLTGGTFGFGETLVVTEVYKILKCNASTSYAAGWGCDPAPANWCDTKTGTGSTSMVSGTPNYTTHTMTLVGYTDMCTPFVIRNTYNNAGSGNTAAATMYDVILRKGDVYFGGVPLGSIAANYLTLGNAYVRNVAAGTNSVVVPFTFPSSGAGARIHSSDLSNFFTTDPDGAGVGLEDVDGDGFYDDLPPGNTVTLDIEIQMTCAPMSCGVGAVSQDHIGGDIKYFTMCDKTTRVTTTGLSGGAGLSTRKISVTPAGYIPANINPGTPFDVNIGINYYDFYNYLNTSNTKYEYQITLPAGTTVNSAKWANGAYNPTGTTSTVTFTQVGNVVTITSPLVSTATTGWGWVKLNLSYNCSAGSNYSITWKLFERNNVVTGCNCRAEQVCGTLTSLAFCPSPCAVGPTTGVPLVQRADNSLGWTDYTLATRRTRAQISAYDLSKALYLDDIEITGSATQNNAASNMFVELTLDKAGAVNKLTPKNIDVVIKRGGSQIGATMTLTSFSQSASTASVQSVVWDLTAAVTAIGGLQANDVVEVLSRYEVATNNLPQHDVQSGKTWSFFNLNTSSVREQCNTMVPEMYLVGVSNTYSQSIGALSACTAGVPNQGFFTASFFDSSGFEYTNEFRPQQYIEKVEMTLPVGYQLVSTTVQDYSGVALTTITPDSVVGNVYTYINPGTWRHDSVRKLGGNGYGLTLQPTVIPTCGSASNTDLLVFKYYAKEFYYDYATDAVKPTTYDVAATSSKAITYSNAPALTLNDQTGTVQASKPNESFVVRLDNASLATAPYTWLSFPTTAGVTITQVVDVATNTAYTPIAYSGGVWVQLSTTGIAPNNHKDYRIDFTYSTCVSTTFPVEGGWNCGSYPTDPSTYTCGKLTKNLTFVPQGAEIQIVTVSQPSGNVNLCTPLSYVYRVNSAGPGNTIDNTFSIDLPAGTSFVAGSLQAEYPVGSGNWQAVTSSVAGTITTLDLTTHTAYPAQGLPGVLNNGGVPNNQLMGIKFQLQTDCNFISGSNLTLSAGANRSCGAPATGDGVGSASLSVK